MALAETGPNETPSKSLLFSGGKMPPPLPPSPPPVILVSSISMLSSVACGVYVLHIKPLFLSIDIHPNQCRPFNPIIIASSKFFGGNKPTPRKYCIAKQ